MFGHQLPVDGTMCLVVINHIFPFANLIFTGELTQEELLNGFGSSKQFINSAAHALQGNSDHPKDLSNSLEAACQVASCTYEYNTDWGKKVRVCPHSFHTFKCSFLQLD